jgi:FAD/FMN-containing dehydrogenase
VTDATIAHRAIRHGRCGRSARTSPKRSVATVPTSSTTFPCRCPQCRASWTTPARELGTGLARAPLRDVRHLGDGNLHYNLAAPEGIEPESFLANTALVNRIVYDLVAKHGGSVSAEHGIGQQKREELVATRAPSSSI